MLTADTMAGSEYTMREGDGATGTAADGYAGRAAEDYFKIVLQRIRIDTAFFGNAEPADLPFIAQLVEARHYFVAQFDWGHGIDENARPPFETGGTVTRHLMSTCQGILYTASIGV